MKNKAYLLVLLLLAGCTPYSPFRAVEHQFGALITPTLPFPDKVEKPVLPEARLAVLWIGHATLLIRIDDKFILTDPVFFNNAGQISRRRIEAAVEPRNLPPLDAVLISHGHIDHLNYGSLEEIEDKTGIIYVSEGMMTYLPEFSAPVCEVGWWKTVEKDGLAVTGLPARHNGMRYGVDLLWRKGTGYGSFLIEYHGIKVYFAGDTGYDAELFKKIGRKFPGIDAALLPMAPVHPQSSRVRHTDPHDAVRLFNDLGAKYLIPMHYETFPENFDTLGEVSALLEKEVENGNISREQLIEIPLGGRVILIPSRLR